MSIQESGIFLLLTKNRWLWHWPQALMLCLNGNEADLQRIALLRWGFLVFTACFTSYCTNFAFITTYLKFWIFFFFCFLSIWYSPYCTSVQTESLKRIFKSYEVNAGKTLTLHKCDISLLSPLEHSILYDLCPSFCSFPLHFCSSPHSSGLEWQCKQNIYIFFF